MPPKRKKEPTRCCVVNCKHNSANSPGTRFYRFPTATVYKYKQERRDKWICAMGRLNEDGTLWEPRKSSRICSQHFVGNQKSEHPLSQSYNPTIFPIVNPRRKRRKRAPGLMVGNENEASTSKNGVDDLHRDVVNENLLRVKRTYPARKKLKKIDQGTQVDCLNDNSINTNRYRKTFTYNQWIHVDRCTTYSNVEIEFYISTNKTDIVKQQTLDKGCSKNHVGDEGKTSRTDICDSDGKEILIKAEFPAIFPIKNDRQMFELTGMTLRNLRLLTKVLPEMSEIGISAEIRLLIFLFKMKQGMSFSALSVLFSTTKSTVSKIFFTTLRYLAEATKNSTLWPSREMVRTTMPKIVQESNKDRIVIDCIEFRIRNISNMRYNWRRTKTDCQKRSTIKVLVACTPCGGISFVSSCYDGETNCAEIIDKCGFSKFLESDDCINADKEFPRITKSNEFGRGGFLMPQFSRDNTFSAKILREQYRAASILNHTKRIVRRLRRYRILDRLTEKMYHHYTHIIVVCCVLVNLQPPIDIDSETH